MKRAVLLIVLLAGNAASFGAQNSILKRHQRLQLEPLGDVQQQFRKLDPKAAGFWVADKLPIDETYAVMAVTASHQSEGQRINTLFGVFVVSSGQNSIHLTLELGDTPQGCSPELENFSKEGAYLHWFADYGLYCGSYKYVFSLYSRAPVKRYVYRRYAVQTSWTDNGRVRFKGSYDAITNPGTPASRTTRTQDPSAGVFTGVHSAKNHSCCGTACAREPRLN